MKNQANKTEKSPHVAQKPRRRCSVLAARAPGRPAPLRAARSPRWVPGSKDSTGAPEAQAAVLSGKASRKNVLQLRRPCAATSRKLRCVEQPERPQERAGAGAGLVRAGWTLQPRASANSLAAPLLAGRSCAQCPYPQSFSASGDAERVLGPCICVNTAKCLAHCQPQ